MFETIVFILVMSWPAWCGESLRSYQQYHRRMPETTMTEGFFSPAYHPNSTDPFWSQADKELPTTAQWTSELVQCPKHIVVDAPSSMYRILKSRYVDSIGESNQWEDVAMAYIVGVPDSLAVGVNCVYDAGTDLLTEVVAPVVPGAFLWGTRWMVNLSGPESSAHRGMDWLPKSMYSIGMPAWKGARGTGDGLQKAVNIPYETISHPLDVADQGVGYYFEPGPTPTPLPLGAGALGQPAPNVNLPAGN